MFICLFSHLFPLFLPLLCCHVIFFSFSTQLLFSSFCDIIYSNPSLFLPKDLISSDSVDSQQYPLHSFPCLFSYLNHSCQNCLFYFFFLISFHHLISLVKNHFLTHLGKCIDSPLFPKAYFRIQFCTVTVTEFTAIQLSSLCNFLTI